MAELKSTTISGPLSGTSASFSGVVSTTSASSIGFLAQTTANSVHPYFRWVANNRSYWAAAIDNGSDAPFSIGNGNTIGASILFTLTPSNNTATFSGDVILPYSKSLAFNSISNQYITADASNLYLGTANLARLTIASTGAATFSSGISVGGATATTGGIQFPATQVAIADANNLDDYEEGTWTPTAIFSAGNGDLSYSFQLGRYVKIGKFVACTAYLLFSESTSSGNLSIGGLPFASQAVGSLVVRFGIGVDNLTGISGMPTGEIGDSASVIAMSYTGTGTATAITNSNTSANAVFRMTFSYIVQN